MWTRRQSTSCAFNDFLALLMCITVVVVANVLIQSAPVAAAAPTIIEQSSGSGGQSLMSRMLAWGVDNSNLADLAKKAEAIKAGSMTEDHIDPEVLAALFPDPNESLKKLLHVVADREGSSVGQRVEALELVRESLEEIDHAKDAIQSPLASVLRTILQEGEHSLSFQAAWTIATTAQHVDSVQQYFVNNGVVTPLLVVLKSSSTPRNVANKALFALGVLVRDNEEARKEALANGLLEALAGVVESDINDSLKAKGLTLASDLCRQDGFTCGMFAAMGGKSLCAAAHLCNSPEAGMDMQEKASDFLRDVFQSLKNNKVGGQGVQLALRKLHRCQAPKALKSSIEWCQRMAESEGQEGDEVVSQLCLSLNEALGGLQALMAEGSAASAPLGLAAGWAR